MQKQPSNLNFDCLRSGDKVRIVCWRQQNSDATTAIDSSYRQNLLAMGLVPGTELKVIRRAPFGDPIQIKVNGFELSLRQHEISSILEIEFCH